MAKYKKFEEWMVGKRVTPVVEKGVVEDYVGNDVYVTFENGTSYWYAVSNLEFPEEAPSKEEKAIPWEGCQIDWQVGQVVWDLLDGKGVVTRITRNQNPIGIQFDNGKSTHAFRDGSQIGRNGVRTIFFSEPTIIAETMPPKKPFVPKLKEGDKIVLSDREMDYITTVVSEDENSIYYRAEDGVVTFVEKGNSVSVYKLGEEIKWD